MPLKRVLVAGLLTMVAGLSGALVVARVTMAPPASELIKLAGYLAVTGRPRRCLAGWCWAANVQKGVWGCGGRRTPARRSASWGW
jgi:hypothetical protein